MRTPESSKLIIPWIENACDRKLYPKLMEWFDKHKKVIFLAWVHKSSENWNESMSKVFEDWAAYKSKLGEKDARDLKAAFRNALRSKKNLHRVKKGKDFQLWQITDEPIETISESTTSGALSSNNKIAKPKQKRGPKKGTRRCNTKKTEIRNDFSSGSSATSVDIPVPTVVNCTQSSTILYTPNNENAVTNSLPSYNSVFNVSPPTPPLQPTDVFLKNLVEPSDFFGISDSERISSPCFRMSSPVLIPSSTEGIPTTASPISNVNNDITTYSAFYDAQKHSKNFSPSQDIFQQTINDVNREQVVPTPNFDLWNYDFSVEQPQILHEIQLDSKQKEMELEAAHQMKLDQASMYNLVPEEPLGMMTELMPEQQMLSNNMDDDIFRYLWDIPEMIR